MQAFAVIICPLIGVPVIIGLVNINIYWNNISQKLQPSLKNGNRKS
jgi:ACR3 family arsenite efflux pump ArsB